MSWPLIARTGRATVLGLSLVMGAGLAQAGLFDDEEARKAILELRSRINANDEAVRARLTELQQANVQLLEQVQQLRRSLVDLNGQLSSQRDETARLRGTQEQLARDLADTQRRLKDAVATLEERLRGFEPQKVTIDGKEFSVEVDERKSHDQAMATLRGGDFDRAAAALSAFLLRYPLSPYADTARFWLGNAQYGQKNYTGAISTFKAMVAAAPNHPRAPEAMLSMANCLAETKDVRGARRTIEELIKLYPTSEAAAAGRERLVTLKG